MNKDNRNQTRISAWQKLSLILFGLFVTLAVLEIGLRLGGFIFLSFQEYRNKASIRQEGAYRILCLGDSLTALGGRESYPSQLEGSLNARGKGIGFSVINKGIPGVRTSYILSQLEDNLKRYTPNMVIIMAGINDGPPTDSTRFHIPATIKIAMSFKTYNLLRAVWLSLNAKLQKEYPLLHKTDGAMGAPALLSGNSGEKYAALGRSYILQGKLKEAEECFKKSLEINPHTGIAYLHLAWIARGKREFRQAEEYSMKLLAEEPLNDLAHTQLGLAYAEQGEYSEAEKAFKKAVEINRYNDRAWGGLGRLYAARRDHVSSQAYFQKASRVRNENYNPVTYANYRALGGLLKRNGIILVCVQYPLRSITQLKEIFRGNSEGIIFVDNEKTFEDAVTRDGYARYFYDVFAGDFGHCTAKGNGLLAENIADTLLEEAFHIATKK